MTDPVQSSRPRPAIPVTRLRVRCAAQDPLDLAPWTGSAIRGLFGHALRKTVCLTGATACNGCLLLHHCPYSQIFETPPPPKADRLRRYTATPHPYILHPPTGGRSLSPGQPFDFGLTLIGQAHRYTPYLLHAFQHMGRMGLGRARFTILSVDQITPARPEAPRRLYDTTRPHEPIRPAPPQAPPAAPAPQPAWITLETPLRTKRDGRFVGAREFRFADLFRGLMRRLALLSYFHTDTPWEPDFRTLARHAQQMDIADAELHWREWSRRSNRQGMRMQMGGLTGRFQLPHALPPSLWEPLWEGQWLHAGKATAMGFGHYTITVPRNI